MSTPVFPPDGFGTLTGTYYGPDGLPATGYVVVTPSPEWIKAADAEYVPIPRKLVLVAGVIPPTEFLSTDAPTNPTGDWTYTISFHLDCVGLRSFAFKLPAGQVTELDQVAAVPAGDGAFITQGPPGDSAYQVWLDQGHTGTEADFLASLQGDPGDPATITGATAHTVAYGDAPTVDVGGTPSARSFDFGIPAGQPGTDGTDAAITGATAHAEAAGSQPTVVTGGTPQARTFDFGIPDGAPGADATITGATASGLPAGDDPTVTLGGTPGARTFDFGIPAGPQGDTGPSGTITGATAHGLASTDDPTVDLGGTPSARTFDFGIPAGTPGTAAQITGATAHGLAAGSSPTVTPGGTPLARTFDFGIPAGAKGDPGDPAASWAIARSAQFHTLPGWYAVSRDNTMALVADTAYLFPIECAGSWTPYEIDLRVNTLGVGSAYVWVYAADPAMGLATGPCLLDVGAISVATTGQKAVTGLTTTLPPGPYIVVLRPSIATVLAGVSCAVPFISWSNGQSLANGVPTVTGITATTPPAASAFASPVATGGNASPVNVIQWR